jgi:hypothetical protein
MNSGTAAASPHGQAHSGGRDTAGRDADEGTPPAIVDATGTAPDLAGLASPCSTEDLTAALATLRDAAEGADHQGSGPGSRAGRRGGVPPVAAAGGLA